VYFFQGKYLDALQSYTRALQRTDATAARVESTSPAAYAHESGTLYEQLGQNEKALDYYKFAQANGAALRR